MPNRNLIADALSQPKDVITYTLSRALKETFPELVLRETADGHFDLLEFEGDGHCQTRLREDPLPQLNLYWDGYRKRAAEVPRLAWREVAWEGKMFQVVTLAVRGNHCDETHNFLMGPTAEAVTAFYESVCAYNSEVRGQVLVFAGGYWSKSAALYEAIHGASYEQVILAAGLREAIRSDFQRFLGSRELYERHGIPWKRGVIFLGPPGNGKTHMVKAVANSLGIPVLYVRSFKAEYETDHDTIQKVFERARQTSPCLLVLEDLDSLVDKGNRSFFLNEMDGFASNTGIIALATANYPERLDPAILDRPSRFDRKYAFELPGLEERQEFLRMWSDRLEPTLRLSEPAIQRIAEETGEFSFAYLKELFLSAMMHWIDRGDVDMEQAMRSVLGPLREQMHAGLDAAEPIELDGDDESAGFDMVPIMRQAFRFIGR